MRSLLVVTEIFEVGGLETHVRDEIAFLSRAGCSVHLATGRRFSSLLLPPEAASLTGGLALGPESTLGDLVQSVEALRRLIRERGVECVHAHPFTSLLPGFIAAELERVPFVMTLHGPASLAGCYGPLHDFVLDAVLLPRSSLVVAVSEEVAGLAAPYLGTRGALVLPNSVDVDRFDGGGAGGGSDPWWLVVSRLDPTKIRGVVDFIRRAAAAGLPGVRVAGEGPARAELERLLEKERLTGYAELLGERGDIPDLIGAARGVAGMGRVALEGLAARKPVFLVGYDGVKGLLDPSLALRAAEANFSGRNLPVVDDTTFFSQVSRVDDVDVDGLRDWVCSGFSSRRTWRTFLDEVSGLPPMMATPLGDAYEAIRAAGIEEGLPFLQSSAFFGQIGRLCSGARHFSPGLLASFRHHFGRFGESKAAADLNAERAEHHGAISERDARIASLERTLVERGERLDEVSRESRAREARVIGLLQSVARSEAETGRARSALVARESRISELEASLSESEARAAGVIEQLSVVTRSRSWRITRPLRIAGRIIRGGAPAAEARRQAMARLGALVGRAVPGGAATAAIGQAPASAAAAASSPAPDQATALPIASLSARGDGRVEPYYGIRRPHGKRRAAILTNQLLDWRDGRPRFGGGERYALELARLLRELSIEVTFFQPTLQARESGSYYSFDVRLLPPADTVGEFAHAFCSRFTELSADFDHVYYHLPEYASGAVREDGLMTCHGIWFDHDNYPGAIFRTPEWFDHLHAAFRSPLGVVSVDTNSISVIRSLWPALARKMRFIPNFYDASSYFPDAGKRDPDRLTVLFPRRSQVNRGSRLFGDIVANVPHDVRIVWLGEGDPEDTRIVKEVCAADPRASFAMADFDEMPGWYQKADIAVIPTIACEGTSLSCIEALASGCAVVATHVGGLPDVIRDGLNGLLVEPDAISIANAINRLIEDRNLRERLQSVAAGTSGDFELAKWRTRWVEVLRDYGWISDEARTRWLEMNTPDGPAIHPARREKWVVLTRNAIHGGVESLIREEARLLGAPVIVCGGHDRRDSCPFPYSRADDPEALEAALKEFDVVLYHWLPEWAVGVLAKSNKPSIEFVHRTDTSDGDKSVPAAIVTHSAFLARHVREKYGRPCRVVEHPIALDRFSPRAKLGACIGAVTSYYETKGIDLFLRAWALLKDDFPDVPVRFYGAGDDLERFRALAAQLGVSADFRGPTAEPWSVMGEFRCFVVPSRIEGLPVAILEALAMDVPVVASALPGMIEFNERSVKRGFERFIDLALPEDPTDLARVIRASLEGSSRRQSSRYIREYYSPDKHVADLVSAYRELSHRGPE